jgi:DNA polymerase-3 subunit gamma/tau
MRMDASMTRDEFTRGLEFSKSLTLQALTRFWQMLTKGLQEIKDSPRPLASADMVLVRLAYAADLPSPEDVLRKITSAPPAGESVAPTRALSASAPTPPRMQATAGGAASAMRQPSPGRSEPQARASAQPAPAPAPRVKLVTFEDVVTLAQVNRDIQLKIALERDVRLLRFEEGTIEFSLVEGASPQIAQTLMRRLQDWTGIRWMVAISREEGGPTLKEQANAREQVRMTGVRAEPLVRSVLERFPGSEIVAIRSAEAEQPPASALAIEAETADAGGDEIGYADQIYTDEDL